MRYSFIVDGSIRMQERNDPKWRQPWVNLAAEALSLILWLVVAASVPAGATPVGASPERISLDGAVVLVDSGEPSYLLYGAKDFASYLTDITGKPVAVSSSLNAALKAKSVIAIGKEMARALNVDLGSPSALGDEGAVIRSFDRGGSKVVIIAGPNPHGTNTGLATFMPMIHGEGKVGLSRRPTRSPQQAEHRVSWHPLKWMATEISLCVPFLEGGGLEALYRYRVGAAHQPVLPVAVHGNHSGSNVRGRRSLPAGSPTGCGLRAEPARHGSMDHAVGEPDRRSATVASGIRGFALTG